MAIHRTVKKKKFTVIDNAKLCDKGLSLSARMVLMILLSLWDNYNFSIKNIASHGGIGQDTVRSALQELEANGYLTRKRIRADGQYQGVEYEIYEDPSLNPNFCNAAPPAKKKPAQAKPKSVKPTQAKPHNNIYNNINDIYNNKNQSINQDGLIEDQIKQQIAYDILCHSYDSEHLDNLVGIMVSVMAAQTDTITVSKDTAYSADYVRQCISKITPHHIEQIMDTLKETNPTIHNVRGYLLTMLINAANTMNIGYWYCDH